MPKERLLELARLLRRTAEMHREHAAIMAEYLSDLDGVVADGLLRISQQLDRVALRIEGGEYD